jgi:hypothetical protein
MRPLLLAFALIAAAPAFAQQAPPAAPPPEPESVNGKPGEHPIANAVRLMIEATAEEKKASPLSPVQYGALPTGQTIRFHVSGTSDKPRLLIASCDFDCTKLDMAAFDEQNQPVATAAGGDRPVLALPSAAPGNLVIEMKMTTCSRPTCRFGVGLYQKD